MRLLALNIILTLVCFVANASDTLITGNLPGSHIWNKSIADTFVISGNVTVNDLIVENGVVVDFQSGSLIGSIKVKGTASDKVIFYTGTSATGGVTFGKNDTVMHCDFFNFNQFRVTSDALFRNCKFSGMRAGNIGTTSTSINTKIILDSCEFEGLIGTMSFRNSSFVLSNCEFHKNITTGSIRLDRCWVEIHHSNVHDNDGRVFIMFGVRRGSSIHHNRMHHNRSNVIYAQFQSQGPDFDFMHNECDSNSLSPVIQLSDRIDGKWSYNVFHHNRYTPVFINNGWVRDFSGNIFHNNTSYTGTAGAMYLRPSRDMYLHSNVYVNNSGRRGSVLDQTAISTVDEIYHFNSVFVNNRDSLANASASAVFHNNSQAHHFVNCIFRGNEDTSGTIRHFGGPSRARFISYSNIEGGHVGNNNIDNNPTFINPTSGVGPGFDASNSDWSVNNCTSSARNAGITDSLQLKIPLALMDAAQNQRVASGIVDMGAYETFGTSNQIPWVSGPVCAYQSTFDLEAAFMRNGSPTASTWQVDTGNGVWITIVPGIISGVTVRNDTLSGVGVPIGVGSYNFRVINAFSCFTDTSMTWSPLLAPRTFSFDTTSICQKDSIFLGGMWRNQSGSYLDTLVNWLGCDSIHRTELIVIPEPVVDVYDTICPGGELIWNGTTYRDTGVYSFRSLISNGCDSITRLNLAMHPNYLGSATDTTVGCLGDTITFNVGNPNILTYQWSDGTNTGTDSVFQIVPTNFWQRTFVTVTDVNGCTVTATRDFLEFSFGSWGFNVDNSNDPEVVFDFSVPGPPANASFYYWAFGDGDTASGAPVTHTYTSNGTYQYCGIVVGLCGADSLCNSIEIQSVGQNELNSNASLLIYPNPASDVIYIKNKNATESRAIVLFDLHGREVWRNRLDQKAEIDVSSFSPGIYYLHLGEGLKAEKYKVVID